MDKLTEVWTWLTNEENQKAILGLLAFTSTVSTVLAALVLKIWSDFRATRNALSSSTDAIEEIEIKEKAGLLDYPPAKMIKDRLKNTTELPGKSRMKLEESVEKSKTRFLDMKNRLKGRNLNGR